MFKCEQCDFSSFNEKALAQHIEERHRPKPKKPREERPREERPREDRPREERPREERSREERPREERPREKRNFLREMLKKPVKCQTFNKDYIIGTLDAFGDYEVLIQGEDNKKILIFKHGLISIELEELEKVEKKESVVIEKEIKEINADADKDKIDFRTD